MRKVSLDKIQAGIRVARTIHTLDGLVLLTAGTKINEEIVNKLKNHGITEIYAEDRLSFGIEVPELVKEEILTDVKTQVKQLLTMPSVKISVDGKKITELVDTLINNILKEDLILAALSDIRSIDDYTFSHSVNVCILSIITGSALGLKGESLKDLATGALLHDIGKMSVSYEILQKPSSLLKNEFIEVKKHTEYGYEVIKNSRNLPPSVALIALCHHERMDGSGYPHQLKGNDIPFSARIVAVADVFDALTSDRVYRQKMMPHEVVDYMCSLSQRHFDKNVLDAFIRHVAYYPVGTAVVLNSGEKGLIARNNSDFPARPVVRIVMDDQGKMLAQHQEVDLARHLEYRILDIWDI